MSLVTTICINDTDCWTCSDFKAEFGVCFASYFLELFFKFELLFILQLYEKSQSDNSATEANDALKSGENKNATTAEDDLEDEEDDEDDDSSTGSSASITDFVPSAWNSQATPSRPALRSPDKKTVSSFKKFSDSSLFCKYYFLKKILKFFFLFPLLTLPGG